MRPQCATLWPKWCWLYSIAAPFAALTTDNARREHGLMRRTVFPRRPKLEKHVAGQRISEAFFDGARRNVKPVRPRLTRPAENRVGFWQVKIGEPDCLGTVEVDIDQAARLRPQQDADIVVRAKIRRGVSAMLPLGIGRPLSASGIRTGCQPRVM